MKLVSAFFFVALVVAALASAGAIVYAPYDVASYLRVLLAIAFLIAVLIAQRALRRSGGPVLAVAGWLALFALGPLFASMLLVRPSNDRNWSPDQARLARIDVDGDVATVHDVRNFHYRSTSDYDARWEDRRYDLAQLRSAWFVVEPFSDFAGAAHTFLSFGFANGEYLAVSVEIRKEKGESFSALKGLYRNYELMYVFGDERDLVQLRSAFRKDTVYAYPLRVSPEVARAMLEDIFARANRLAEHPEFYNSLTNTCTTNIAGHANRLKPGAVPFSWQLLLPGHSDERALELGLIDFDGDITAARERFRINERAAAAGDAADFPARIRALPAD